MNTLSALDIVCDADILTHVAAVRAECARFGGSGDEPATASEVHGDRGPWDLSGHRDVTVTEADADAADCADAWEPGDVLGDYGRTNRRDILWAAIERAAARWLAANE